MARVACPVFISYSRATSAKHAGDLASRLGTRTFFDTESIDDGDDFPERLMTGLLDARVVVIFATAEYVKRRFCRLEMKLALAGGASVVLALGDGSDDVMAGLPTSITGVSMPEAGATDRLVALVEKRLAEGHPAIRERLSEGEARRLAKAFREESHVPPPLSLRGVPHSFPEGAAVVSIGERFVGRADLLRAIHRALGAASGAAAQLTGRITAGGGFGKTRLAAEYAHRYGATHYKGGVFWVDASASSMSGEYWRVLRDLDPATPELKDIPDVKGALRAALRRVEEPVLWVADNIPEAKAGEAPMGIHEFCPAVGEVAVLATSRQDTREEQVRRIEVDTLESDAAVLLLTDGIHGWAGLTLAEWERVAEWVGRLPIALDLLNRSLALGESARALLGRVGSGTTGELDGLAEALRGQVPAGAVRGVSEVFRMSLEALDEASREVAMILAELAPTPIPMVVMEEIPQASAAVRMALRSRHFVSAGGGELSFGVMHRLMADYLRGLHGWFLVACAAVERAMTPNKCQDPRAWPEMRLCHPHADALFVRAFAAHTTTVAVSRLGLRVGILAYAQGDYSGARGVEERVLEVATRVLGQEHVETLKAMNNLSTTLFAQGEYVAARQLGETVLELRTNALGEDHPETLRSMGNLAETLAKGGDQVGARRLKERVFEAMTRILGEGHPDTLRSMGNLALTLRMQGDYIAAQRVEERAVEMRAQVLGEEHPDTLRSMSELAQTLRLRGDHGAGRRIGERVLEVRIRVLGRDHPDTLASMNSLAVGHFDAGDYQEALRLGHLCMEGRRKALGKMHPDTVVTEKLVQQIEASKRPRPGGY